LAVALLTSAEGRKAAGGGRRTASSSKGRFGEALTPGELELVRVLVVGYVTT
jgi:hypothetical protein